jgi:alpha-glucosidase (family GH31 glycosyl hydrolase)
MPYIYSNERVATETGIGLVRPLFWEFPDDDRCSDESAAWMFGDALLVSPVVEMGQADHKFYLPQGSWFDYSTGKPVHGGTDISIKTDGTTWQDIPLYVRDGSILASQPSAVGNELSPTTPLVLDVFPSAARAANFVVYDDDGHTYTYETGEYFRQEFAATRSAASTDIQIQAATGTYKAHFPTYVLRVHQPSQTVTSDGTTLKKFASEQEFLASNQPGWFSTSDRFGAVTEVRLPVEARAHSLKLAGK